MNIIKKSVPVVIKRKIKILFVSTKNSKWVKVVSKERMNIYIFLAGFYQNLGDMAITYAQSEFLKDIFPDANIVLVPSTETYSAVKVLRNHISNKDLITITGGGNMDDGYASLEDARLHIVTSFPENRIVCFPQTMFYSNTEYGFKRKKISQTVYNKHSRLTLFAREKDSFDRMRQCFPNVSIGYCPDIVLYLHKAIPQIGREYITCCFRSDKEQKIHEKLKLEIIDYLKGKYDLRRVDTVDVDIEECKPDKYKDTLEKFWKIIKESRLVMTDRLHCMIFCVITGTPCIAFDNTNHKIRGVYESWLRDIKFLKLVYDDSFEEIAPFIEYLLNIENNGETPDLSELFKVLKLACVSDM